MKSTKIIIGLGAIGLTYLFACNASSSTSNKEEHNKTESEAEKFYSISKASRELSGAQQTALSAESYFIAH